jgi:hypothetical protein
MQLLYAATSVEFGHALRMALEGEGIETHFTDSDLSIAGLGIGATGERIRIYVPMDDYPQAAEVLQRMLAEDEARLPAKPVAPPRKPMPMWLVIVGAACMIAVVGAMVSP